METSTLVFLVGSILSFLPIYWLLERRWPAPPQMRRIRRANPAVALRRDFLNSLRREAAARAVAAARNAAAIVSDSENAGSAKPFDPAVLRRMEDTRSMLHFLLPPETSSAFERILLACRRADMARAAEIQSLVLDLEKQIASALRTPPSSNTSPPLTEPQHQALQTA